MKQYVKPKMEACGAFEDIMAASSVVPAPPEVEAVEENETLKGVIDIENLISRIQNLIK